MIIFPNAKINLFLNVKSKRSDGFHNIDSAIYPIPLYDVLEYKESKKFSLKIYGKKISCDIEENTVFRVWKLLKKDFDLPALEIALLKNIPEASGLGGGSSDAAFLIKSLNKYFKLELDDNRLITYALKIGSDCPFFIKNKPAVIKGRGEIINNIDFDMKGYYLQLIFPDEKISTSRAYKIINPVKPDIDGEKYILSKPVNSWHKFLRNDFETVLPSRLLKIKEELYKNGAVYASLTGSGSSFFGLFNKKPEIIKEYKSLILQL